MDKVYLLYFGFSADSTDQFKYVGFTLDKNQAHIHFTKCDMYSKPIGKVVIASKDTIRLAVKQDFD